MKNKNQISEQNLLESAANAANEEGFSGAVSRESAVAAREPSWSPYEVWRTRVKAPAQKQPPARRT